MIRKPDSLYYSERLHAERKACAEAHCESARAAHQALAEHYAQILGGIAEPLADFIGGSLALPQAQIAAAVMIPGRRGGA